MLRPKSPSHFSDGIKILLCGGVLLALCVGGLCYASMQLKVAAKGPQEITGEEIAKITKLADMPNPWVTFTFEKSVPTEFAMVKGSNQVEWVYDLVQVGDQWLLAGVPKDFQGNRLKGQLQTIPKKDLDDIRAATQEIHQGRLMPFQFDGHLDFAQNAQAMWWVMASGCGLTGLFFLYGLALVIRSFCSDPNAEPATESTFADRKTVEVENGDFVGLSR
jgi:hypothetical protein